MHLHPLATGGDVHQPRLQVLAGGPPAVDHQEHVAAQLGRDRALGPALAPGRGRVDAQLVEAGVPLLDQGPDPVHGPAHLVPLHPPGHVAQVGRPQRGQRAAAVVDRIDLDLGRGVGDDQGEQDRAQEHALAALRRPHHQQVAGPAGEVDDERALLLLQRQIEQADRKAKRAHHLASRAWRPREGPGHPAPGSTAAIACRRPRWWSRITRRTPTRPRATWPRRKLVQAAPSSAVKTAQELPVAVGVDPARDRGADVDHPATLAAALGQSVDPDPGGGTAVERPVAEVLDHPLQALGHHRDLRLREPLDAQGLDQALDPPGGDPGQVGPGDHGHHRPFGAAPRRQQPAREVAALAQPGQGELDRAHPGVPVPLPVAIAGADPLPRALTVAGAAELLGLGAHQLLHEGREHLAEQVGMRHLQLLAHPGDDLTVHTGVAHRIPPSGG